MSLCNKLKNKWCGDPPSRKQTEAQINKRGCGPVNKNSCTTYNYKNSNANKKAKEIANKKAKLIARRNELRQRNKAMKKNNT